MKYSNSKCNKQKQFDKKPHFIWTDLFKLEKCSYNLMAAIRNNNGKGNLSDNAIILWKKI